MNKALSFAVTENLRKTAKSRLNTIELMTWLYKADVAESKATPADLDIALGHLKEAASLDLNHSQAELVKQKIDSANELMKRLKASQAEAAK